MIIYNKLQNCKIITAVLIAVTSTFFSSCLTAKKGEFIAEKVKRIDEKAGLTVLQILENPSYRNPYVKVRLVQNIQYTPMVLREYKEVLGLRDGLGISLPLLSVLGGSLLIMDPEDPARFWTGAGLCGLGVGTLKIFGKPFPTGRIIHEQESQTRRNVDLLLASKNIYGKVDNVKIGYKTDASGILAIDLVRDFKLTSFKEKKVIRLDFLQETGELIESVLLDSSMWTKHTVKISFTRGPVFKEPKGNSEHLFEYKKGDYFEILMIKGDWIQVMAFNKPGWIPVFAAGTISWEAYLSN